MFADPESKLSKYGPKSWRSSHTHGLDANGRPLLELHFRVQFYIESPFMLKDETSRHNYYLQLRHNILQRELPREQAEQALVFLSGLALQADLGDAPPGSGSGSGAGTGHSKEDSGEEAAASPSPSPAGGARGLSATTTLPKISKRANERMLRLSTYVASTSKRDSVPLPLPPSLPSSGADYFRMEEYLPGGLHTAWARSAMRACHREHLGMAAAEAELLYIQQACSLHETINAHTYRMRLAKSEQGSGSAWFVVYAKGIKILGGAAGGGCEGSEAAEATTFLWPNITKLSFERKKFEIRSGESRITLYAASDEKNKLLLTLCKDTHQWSMKLAARLKEVSKREEEEAAESQRLHASYACSRSLLLPYKSKNEQRISVISSTSSNTTSGIVSDRVHSEDELEIMINTPPAPLAAPSTESLALAHLLDRPSVSRQTSSVGQMSLKDLEEQLAALSVRTPPDATSSGVATSMAMALATSSSAQRSSSIGAANNDSSTATDSPSSQHNIGSQCSSTCSTVVVTSPAASGAGSSPAVGAPVPVHSTSSSLELGFSHTAQNSALSEASPEDFLSTSARDVETESVSGASGVYTLAHGAPPTETSGVYTMHSSELTGQSSELAESEKSSHYGLFQPQKLQEEDHVTRTNSVDGKKTEEFRLRSDSNVSTSSSFRGDGSDPTDNKHSLLSAEELTNLIVGRGTYPSRKTVSSSLHSDCDYVTLPMGGESGGAEEDHHQEQELPPAPPPPYSARHEKTGLCGPPIQAKSVVPKPVAVVAPKPDSPPCSPPVAPLAPLPAPPAALRRRDPPPYSSASKPRPTSLISVSSSANPALPPSAAGSMSSLKSEEVTARFITTRPQISILKAHTSLLPDGAKPSYAAPHHCSSVASSNGSVCSSHQLSQMSQLSQQSLHNSNYAGGSQASLHHHSHHQHHLPAAAHHRHSGSAAIGIPIVPYGLHKSTASLHHQQSCVLLPVIKPRQFLPPPPPSLPRQPPPPPPPSHQNHHPHPHLAGHLYGRELARKQLELYQQQLYSDVDYVIYPIQDPAVSQQEYLDAKQGSLLAAMAQAAPPPPHHPYLAMQVSPAIYRSTPYLPLALSTHSRYASTQNLSDTYVQLPGASYSPLYSPSMASLCSSYEPPPPPPLHPAALASGSSAAAASSMFARSRSDDNILNSLDSLPKGKRLPPPPPPPYVNRRLKKPPMPAPSEKPPPIPSKPSPSMMSLLPPRKPPTLNPHHANSPLTKTSSGAQWAGERPRPDLGLGMGRGNNSILAQLQASMAAESQAQAQAQALDIALLREKSKHLDLPLISALCNDRSLLKQTKVMVNPKTGQEIPMPAVGSSPPSGATTNGGSHSSGGGTLSKMRSSKGSTVSHRHPQDKLPPLPVQQLAEANNYVIDPAVMMKQHHQQQHHKTS
ncbi:protein expanded isoform X2 [Drosophila ficusphila]|nr:protein expanded isoform X2 [Drosophila ficusphila]